MRIQLRAAVEADAEMIYKWRNDPFIISKGTVERVIPWEEHQAWFQETVQGTDRQLYIVLGDEVPIGQVRFDRVEPNRAEISIYLLREHTGRGLGIVALQKACHEIIALWNVNWVTAFVRSDNIPSISAFPKAGFVLFKKRDECSRKNHVEFRFARPFLIPHSQITHDKKEQKAVVDVISSGHWACGPQVKKLEKFLANYAKAAHVICVSSGLSALRLTLKSLGIESGDEVIVPAYCCVALVNAVLSLGANVIPVDVIESEWNIDPVKAKQSITPRTRAIIAVHTFGLPADIDSLQSLDVPVIEDCAHAFGREVKGKALGNHGYVAILSFYATKLMGAGEGGAVLSYDPQVIEFIREWRDYTDKSPDPTRLNDKMTDIEASLALCQLERLESMIAQREKIANFYQDYFLNLSHQRKHFHLPVSGPDRIWYRYSLEMISCPSQPILDTLKQHGIQAEKPNENWRDNHYPPCPVADRAFQHLVSLPIYPTLSEEKQLWICRTMEQVLDRILSD